MIKGQVLTGGRGKAGAIRAVSAQAEAESAAREILGMSVNEFPEFLFRVCRGAKGREKARTV